MTDNSRLDFVADRFAIIDVIVGMANALDAKDWRALRACLASELGVDYCEFRGEPPSRMTAEAYVESRRQGLQDLRTLHLSTNHQVTLTGDEAVCVSAYRIYRLDPRGEPGKDRLDSAGHYRHRLVRTGDAWKVTHIAQTVVLLEGNRGIHGAFR
jgi:3-phenylpropionate/cinnamic acid dioxygenase small subunit